MSVGFSLILAVIALTFAWQAYRGFSKGSTRFPLSLLAVEEFDSASTHFWGIVASNIAVAIAAGTAAVFVARTNLGTIS